MNNFEFTATVNLTNAAEVKALNDFVQNIHAARANAQNERMAANLAAVDEIIADAVQEAVTTTQEAPKPTQEKKKLTTKVETQPEVKSEPQAEPQAGPQAEPEQEAPAAEEKATTLMPYTLEDVREAIRACTAANRAHGATLKAKLEELGATNATTLAPEHYADFIAFINGLD